MISNIKKVIEKFDFTYKKIVPINSIYILVYTNKDIYLIKKEKLSINKIMFTNDFKKHLANNNFQNFDKYIISKEGPYVNYNDDIFIMKKLIPGDPCSVKKINELEDASKTLGRMHIASKGYRHSQNINSRSNLGKWPEILLGRCEDFTYIRCLMEMKSKKTYLDKLFLDNIEKTYEMAIEATKSLQENKYFEWSQLEGKGGYVCHYNYNYNNVIIDKHEKNYMINFEYCRYDLRCFDLANFIIVTLSNLNWDFDKGMKIIKAYNTIRSIEKYEYRIMYSFFKFPFIIWKRAKEYYYKDVFLSKTNSKEALINALHKIPLKISFLERFYEEFL